MDDIVTQRKTARKLFQAEVVRVADVLRRHCAAQTDNGRTFAVYDEEWDDERVARESNIAGCHLNHVAGIRRTLIGELRPTKFVSPNVDAQIERLSERLQVYNDGLVALTSRVRKLERWIATNFGPIPEEL